jgi:hypothetical protein
MGCDLRKDAFVAAATAVGLMVHILTPPPTLDDHRRRPQMRQGLGWRLKPYNIEVRYYR